MLTAGVKKARGNRIRKSVGQDCILRHIAKYRIRDIGVSPTLRVPFGGPNNRDYNILGSILGSPYWEITPSSLSDTLSEEF